MCYRAIYAHIHIITNMYAMFAQLHTNVEQNPHNHFIQRQTVNIFCSMDDHYYCNIICIIIPLNVLVTKSSRKSMKSNIFYILDVQGGNQELFSQELLSIFDKPCKIESVPSLALNFWT